MNTIDLFIIGAFIALLIPSQSRLAAKFILISYAIYFNFIIDLAWDDYYLYSATLNTILGVTLYRQYRVVAILSFSLIIANYIGYLLCLNRYEPTIYDNICLIIILLQIIMLTIRGLLNGINRQCDYSPLVFLVNFDSNKNHAKIQKRSQE
jgi:hypothetical protein